MVKAGIVDFDTSHSVQFTMRFNHQGIAEDQWVDGVQVVAGLPGKAAPGNEQRQGEFIEQCKGFGVKMVDSVEALMKEVDVVMVEALEGGRHLERARPFLEAGMRVFVDKPFADNIPDAEAMAELAEKHGAALMAGSALRYVLEVQELRARAAETGKVLSASVYSPSKPLGDVPALVNYGCHSVEMLYAILREGCREVCSVSADTLQSVTGRWADGRAGVVLGVQEGKCGFGFTAFCENETVQKSIDFTYGYRELVKEMSAFFNTGKAPVPVSESVEVVKFIVKALESDAQKGKPVAL